MGGNPFSAPSLAPTPAAPTTEPSPTDELVQQADSAAKRRAVSPAFAKKMTAAGKADDKKERKPLYGHPSSKKM